MIANRRGFLSGLASLPLIGGSVALIGAPRGSAVPVTRELLHSYKNWLHMEHRMVSFEMAGHDLALSDAVEQSFTHGYPGDRWHLQWTGRGPAGWIDAPQPSTRAALVLSAVGCDLVKPD